VYVVDTDWLIVAVGVGNCMKFAGLESGVAVVECLADSFAVGKSSFHCLKIPKNVLFLFIDLIRHQNLHLSLPLG